jgi:hypothetical protein
MTHSDTATPTSGIRNQSTARGIEMRNHRLLTLLSTAVMSTATGLAVASPAQAENQIVKLVSAENGKCLQPVNGSPNQGDAIVQQSCNGSVAQQWTVTPVSSTNPELREEVATHLGEIEAFFRRAVIAAQEDGAVPPDRDPADLARLLLGVTLGLRVLARSTPQRELLEGVVRPALTLLDWPGRASQPSKVPL